MTIGGAACDHHVVGHGSQVTNVEFHNVLCLDVVERFNDQFGQLLAIHARCSSSIRCLTPLSR